MTVRTLLRLTATLLVCAMASTALGNESNDALLRRAVAAKELAMDSGVADDWLSAYTLFKQVLALAPSPGAAYEAGVVAVALQQDDLAVEAYELAVALGLGGSALRKANAYLAKHAAPMARVDVQGPEGTQLFVRGFNRGQLPLAMPLVLTPQATVIQARATSGDQSETQLSPAAGQQLAVTIFFEQPVTREPESSSKSETDPVAQTRSSVAPSRHTEPLATSTMLNASRAGSPPSSIRAHARAGWLLVGIGATIGLIGGGFVPLASKRIEQSRIALRNACEVQTEGPDTCEHAKVGLQAQGQSASDAIATWKAIRISSWITMGTGLAAVITGSSLLATRSSSRERTTTSPSIAFDFRPFGLTVAGQF